MRIFIVLHLLCIALSGKADYLDSLTKALAAHPQEDTTRIYLLSEIAWEQSYFDPAASIASSNEALAIAKKINDPNGIASVYNLLGINMRTLGKLDEAIAFFHMGLKIRKEQNNQHKIAALLLNLSNVYLVKEDYSKAITLYKRVLKLSDSLDYPNPRPIALVNLAMCYERSGDFKKALDYEFQSLALNRQMRDTLQEGYSLLTIAVTFHKQKQTERSLDFLQQALNIFEKTKNLDAIGACYNNLGLVHSGRKNYSEALKSYQKAYDIYMKMGTQSSAALILHNMGSVYENLGDLNNALLHQQKVLTIINPDSDLELYVQTSLSLYEVYSKLGNRKNASSVARKLLVETDSLHNPQLLSTIYEAMAVVESWEGNFQKSFEYQQKVTTLKDSLFTNEASRQMAQMEAIYETEKKEKEIGLLTKEKEVQNEKIQKQRLVNYSVGGGLLLLGGMSLLMYSRYREKKKSNLELQEKNTAIVLQKQEIEMQHSIIESKNKDITDSINYAKRIQSSFLPSPMIVEKTLPEHFILYRPKDIVSGDFYWIAGIPGEDGKFLVATADCTGHGVPGAFMSIIGVSLLNEIVLKRNIYDTGEILNQLRTGIIKAVNPEGSAIEAKDGMDISICYFDLPSSRLHFSGANNSLWIVKNSSAENELVELKADKFPVGKSQFENTPFAVHTAGLSKGDIVYMFSDGYADQFGGPQGKKYKKKQLQSFLIKISQNSLPQQKVILEQEFLNWQGNLEQVDDICVIGIRI